MSLGWRHLIDQRGVLLAVLPNPTDVDAIVLADDIGVVIGHIFDRSGRRCEARDFDRKEAYAAAEVGGGAWTKKYWGAYAVFFHDRRHDVMRIVRDPMGSRPVFYATHEGVAAAFTHVCDYLTIGARCEIDTRALQIFLAHARHVSSRTGFLGVSELLAGNELRFWRDGVDTEAVWSPRQSRAYGRGDFKPAAKAVHDAVCEAGRAWSSAPRILHRLSGGLDSSAALYALMRHKSEGAIVAINQRAPFAESDERRYAREVARCFGVELIEYEARPDDASYERLLAVEPEARPTLSSLSFADPAFARAAGALVGSIVSSGQGGDQIFHRSNDPLIIADALRDGVSSDDVFQIAADNARHSRRSVWSGAALALRHGLLRQPVDAYATRAAETPWASISDRVARTLLRESAQRHPWRDCMRETPARAVRVRKVIDLQYYHQPSSLTLCFQPALVLASQPVVELCLSIAPYLMVEGGIDRALERAAFAAHLPTSVVARRGKGDSTRYVAKVLERNFSFMRDMLVDGELVALGLLDRTEIVRVFEQSINVSQVTKVGAMNTIVAELWLRRVRSVQAGAARLTEVPL